MKKILWMPVFIGINSVSAMMVPGSLPVKDLQAIADEAAQADDQLTADEQEIITTFENNREGLSKLDIPELEALGKKLEVNSPKNRRFVYDALKLRYEEIMRRKEQRLQSRRSMFSAQLEQVVLDARNAGFSDNETAGLLSSLIKQSGNQPVSERLKWISKGLSEAKQERMEEESKRREEEAAARGAQEASTFAAERVHAGLNQIANAIGMKIDFSPGQSLDALMTGVTTSVNQMVQSIKRVPPDLLKALTSGNFDQARAIVGANASPAVQQAITIGQEAKADVLRTVGAAVPDLDKKMDMIRERYSDDYIDDIQTEISNKNYQIIDVIGYTLIVDSKSGDENNPFTSELVQECSSAIKKNEFDRSSELFFANNDSKTVRKLKVTLREKDQSIVLSNYVERSKRQLIDTFTSGTIAEVFNPLLKQRSLFDEDQFNRLAITINGDPKFKLQAEDMSVLFRNPYQLLNDAAALHQLSIDRDSFVSALDQLPIKIEKDLKKIEANMLLVSGAMNSLNNNSMKDRLKGIIDKSNNIVRSMRVLLQNLADVQNEIAQHHDIKAFQGTIKCFNDTKQVVGDFYGFLNNNGVLNGSSDVDITKALNENEAIISRILMASSKIVENILIKNYMPQPQRNLKSISFTNFIDILGKSINMFLDEKGEKQKLLETDACSYSFQTAGISERIYAGELCAELISSSIKLLGAVYRGENIDKNFNNFKQVIELISQVQPIGSVNEFVGQIIKQAKNIPSALEDIREFCKCLSQYNKEKSALNNSVSLSVQFVTNQKMPIDPNFSNMLSSIRNKIDEDLESALHVYSVPDDYPLQKKIAFLINADCGMINDVAVGIPFRVNYLIQRPTHHIQVMNRAKAAIQQPYLFHGTEIHGVEAKINAGIRAIAEEMINGNNINYFTQQFKKDIDAHISTIEKAKRAYIPAYVERDSSPVESSLHAIIMTPKASEMNKHALMLCLLDAIVSRPKILGDIRAGSMKKLFEPNEVDVDLINKLSAYVNPLNEIKEYLDNKLRAYSVKVLPSSDKNKIFNIVSYKTGESLLSALERIKKSLEGLSAPVKKAQVVTPESIAKKVNIQARFDISAAAKILDGLSVDVVVAVLQRVQENYINGILDNIAQAIRGEVRNRLNR